MSGLGKTTVKVPRYDTNFALCIICQDESREKLVEDRSMFATKLWTAISERAAYGDQLYPEVHRRLKDVSQDELILQKAAWHRSCYQDAVHAGKCERARKRYENKLDTTMSTQSTTAGTSSGTFGLFTRSKSLPYDNALCFFCGNQETIRHKLHKVRTDKAGSNLHAAINKSNDDKLRVKLSTAINPADAHAIDVQYHNDCWTTHVTNVLRISIESPTVDGNDELAANIEFISLLKEDLHDGLILNMNDLHIAYTNIGSKNGVAQPECSRKNLKDLIINEIPDVEFHKSKKRNEPELVSVKNVRDSAVNDALDKQERDKMADMKVLFDAASILRIIMLNSPKWYFTGSLANMTEEHIPKELYTFCRWAVTGNEINPAGTGENSCGRQECKITCRNDNIASFE